MKRLAAAKEITDINNVDRENAKEKIGTVDYVFDAGRELDAPFARYLQAAADELPFWAWAVPTTPFIDMIRNEQAILPVRLYARRFAESVNPEAGDAPPDRWMILAALFRPGKLLKMAHDPGERCSLTSG
jgi:hypothetical protein